MARILVTGSRDWADRRLVYQELNFYCGWEDLEYPKDEYGNTLPDPAKVTVIHGGCPTGADIMADDWCLGRNFTAEVHFADWSRHGKRAGYIRNKEMVDLGADICFAFIQNHSKGASMTVDLAKKAGIPVVLWELNRTVL